MSEQFTLREVDIAQDGGKIPHDLVGLRLNPAIDEFPGRRIHADLPGNEDKTVRFGNH